MASRAVSATVYFLVSVNKHYERMRVWMLHNASYTVDNLHMPHGECVKTTVM